MSVQTANPAMSASNTRRVRYRLKQGTHSTGMPGSPNYKIYQSSDKNNNIIEVDERPEDIPLCSREPDRYELVSDIGRFGGVQGSDYNLTYDPEVYRAEAARLNQIARLLEEKQAKGSGDSISPAALTSPSSSSPSPTPSSSVDEQPSTAQKRSEGKK